MNMQSAGMKFTWKRTTIWLVALAIGVALGLRLVELQLVKGDHFRVQADDNRFYTLTLQADRGIIFDRYQQPLAFNSKRYFKLTSPTALYSHRSEISRDEGLQLLATDSGQVTTENERLYPRAQSAAHVVGYVGKVTAEELAAKPDLSLVKQYGKYGLEKTFDDVLQGQDGFERFEINALGQRQRLINQRMPQAGESIKTTIDPYLSQVAYQALGAQKGVVLVADAQSGEVLTIISNPSFDPNQLSQQKLDEATEQARVAYVKSLFQAEDQPMFNRAVSGVYPPGSVFKIITALAGLESEAITPSTEVEDQGVLKVGEYEYGNWYFRQYGGVEGIISLVRAIARSNDIYFYKAAEWIGPTQLAEFARTFGFGQPVDVGLYPMAKGIVPDPAWKQSVIGERWYLGNTYHFGIGQGDMLVSPMQILQMMLAVGHEGTLCHPTLVETETQNCIELGVQAQHLETVLQGMIQACSPGGTAFPFFPRNKAVQDALGEGGGSVADWLDQGAIACKTGTAEFGGVDEQGYRKTHGWFVALVEPQIKGQSNQSEEVAEAEGTETATESGTLRQEWLSSLSATNFPERLALVALVESDDDNTFKEGSRDAAPVVKEIIDWVEGSSTD